MIWSSSGRMGRASDRSILQLNWQNGNLMSTEGEFSTTTASVSDTSIPSTHCI